jgi:hypothetical protein
MNPVERVDAAMAALRSKFGGRAESEQVSHQMKPDRGTINPRDVERSPDWYQRERSSAGISVSWSGGSFRGDGWSGGRQR